MLKVNIRRCYTGMEASKRRAPSTTYLLPIISGALALLLIKGLITLSK